MDFKSFIIEQEQQNQDQQAKELIEKVKQWMTSMSNQNNFMQLIQQACAALKISVDDLKNGRVNPQQFQKMLENLPQVKQAKASMTRAQTELNKEKSQKTEGILGAIGTGIWTVLSWAGNLLNLVFRSFMNMGKFLLETIFGSARHGDSAGTGSGGGIFNVQGMVLMLLLFGVQPLLGSAYMSYWAAPALFGVYAWLAGNARAMAGEYT